MKREKGPDLSNLDGSGMLLVRVEFGSPGAIYISGRFSTEILLDYTPNRGLLVDLFEEARGGGGKEL